MSMGLAGRKQKRNPIVIPPRRHPNGRSVAEDAGYAPAAIRRLADAAIRGMADPLWGTTIGQAFIQGRINSQELAAGKAWDESYRGYLQAINSPSPDPKSISIGDNGRSEPPDPDSFSGALLCKKDKIIVARFLKMQGALNSCGALISSSTRALCEAKDIRSCSYEDLARAKIGLGVLHCHLTDKAKHCNNRP